MVVLSAYKQMQHEGNEALLKDINADNFRRAFVVFRPSLHPRGPLLIADVLTAGISSISRRR